MKKLIWLLCFLGGCSSVAIFNSNLIEEFGPVVLTERRTPHENIEHHTFEDKVQPILEKRCVVCHGCFDAPCQLKLSSEEGILRGANKELVYNGTRVLASQPTRLGIDALTVEHWRDKGFFAVLNEQTQTAQINQQNSLLLQVLKQKQQYPLPDGKLLGTEFSLGLNRPQTCPSPKEFEQYKTSFPLWGMPYALPQISQSEFNDIEHWITKGAVMSYPEKLPTEIQQQVTQWENFFNGSSNKQQLSSRYIYEHLFQASLYFDDTELFTHQSPNQQPKHFFKMVRSATPTGLPIKPLATRRPYDEPKVSQFYYRLMRDTSSVVAKNHMPYRLNKQRMQWIKSLFIEPEYEVNSLPAYTPEIASNPFIAFRDLPVGSRYRFMLEEAHYIIEGFIKGPVCRGQVALNVINDHFWVAFIDPKLQDHETLSEFLSQQSQNLRLPGEDESNTTAVNWLKYSLQHKDYLAAKNKAIGEQFIPNHPLTENLIWNGNGKNPSSSLTIFRHFDSSSVIQGWVGQKPKTAWIITYPLLERIHYLLVAEFDVFGNIGHQLITRLYMDFLRMEGEANFLTLLPTQERQRLTNYWYRNTSNQVKEHLFHQNSPIIQEPSIEYKTPTPIHELYDMLNARLMPAMKHTHMLDKKLYPTLSELENIKGISAHIMPELSLLYDEHSDQVFTLIRNSAHSNITGLLYEEDNRLPEEDYLSVIPGIVGSYPAAFYKINKHQSVNAFVKKIQHLTNESDYEALMDEYGVRRTNKHFWLFSDKLHTWYKKHQPIESGILDYNRLENR